MELNPVSNADGHSGTYVAHRLPCTIQADGPLPTARAFCPFPQPLQSFRGRKLQSAEFNLPSSSQLVFIKECDENDGMSTGKKSKPVKSAVITHNMEPLVFHYEHDIVPTENSAVPFALRWLSISEALHAPTSPPSSQAVPNAES